MFLFNCTDKRCAATRTSTYLSCSDYYTQDLEFVNKTFPEFNFEFELQP